jgi:DHA1 family bicyclomycin/chloramphenicol resistance-like MFS transporter
MYGRRKVMLITIGLQIISQVGAFSAPDIDWLIFWRAVQSMGAGVISVVGTAIISDLFIGDRRARYMSFQEMSFPIAYVIAPVLGAFIFEACGTWRAIFMFTLIAQVIAWFCFFFFLPETMKGKTHTEFKKTFKQYSIIIRDGDFILLNMLNSIVVGSYMMFVVLSPFIYMTDFGISPLDFAYYQFTPMILNILASIIYRRLVDMCGATYCLKMGLKALFVLLPIYFGIGFGVIPCTAHTVLTAVCMQSFIVPFFIPGVASKSIDLYPDNKGMAASVSASLRGLCMSATMLFGIYYIGSDVHKVFLTKGILILLTVSIFVNLTQGNRRHRLKL